MGNRTCFTAIYGNMHKNNTCFFDIKTQPPIIGDCAFK